MFSINAFLHGEYVFQSDMFLNKEEAKNLLRKLRLSDTGVLNYQLFKHVGKGRFYGPSEPDWENMFIEKVSTDEGDVYVLSPENEEEDCGEFITLYGNCWDDDLNGWRIPEEEIEFFMDKGAAFVEENYDEEEEEEEEVYTYDGFSVEYYKKGLVMRCHTNHPLYGEKYLSDGFWNEKLKGWVFKRSSLDELIANGAVLIKEEKHPLSNMKYYNYGRGFLVIPDENHPDIGTKYYHDGFWTPKLNGWFFRGRFKEFLETSGAKFSGDY